MPIEHPLALLSTELRTVSTFPVNKCQKRIQVSHEILMHRHKEEHIKMQIVSCQYFSRGGRIREGLQKKTKLKRANPDFTACFNQYADVVDIKNCCKVKSLRTFKKRCQTDSKFENNLLEWSL